MTRYPTELKQQVIQEYIEGESINHLSIKYSISYSAISKWLKNVPDNHTGRFYQQYDILDDYARIHIKYHGEYKFALIDKDDVERCKSVGIWSMGKNGYIMNCKTGIYLHRFIMNCPDDMEVDHIYHDLLDCRKSKLRLSNSSQQKMNTHIRKDNTSGHRGVYFDSSRNKWCVNIKNSEKRIMKRFDNYEDACEFCDKMLLELHQEFRYVEVD